MATSIRSASTGTTNDPNAELRFTPDNLKKAFSALPEQGYEFARLSRAIHWEKDGQTWIQWTLKDDAAFLWAYDPKAGKAVEVLQVRGKQQYQLRKNKRAPVFRCPAFRPAMAIPWKSSP